MTQPSARVSADQVRAHEGRTVVLTVVGPHAPMSVKGRITKVTEAADGLLVFLEPEGGHDTRMTYHYHDIIGIAPAS